MKKNHLLKNALLIAFLVWSVVIIKQQFNISQYKKEIKTLSQKKSIAEETLSQNKENLEEEKRNINSPEYIKKLAREKLGMYLQNERVYIDNNM